MNTTKYLTIVSMAAFSLNLAAQSCNPWNKRAAEKHEVITAAFNDDDIEGALQAAAKCYVYLLKYPERCKNDDWFFDTVVTAGMVIVLSARAGHCETSKTLLANMTKNHLTYLVSLPAHRDELFIILNDSKAAYEQYCKGGSP